MGREIKFRGKRKDNGKWTYGDLIQLLGEQGDGRRFIVDNRFGACIDENGYFVNTEAPFVNEVDPETVGQYTGLKDKNGREIYEGDVVDWYSGLDPFVVEWSDANAAFATADKSTGQTIHEFDFSDLHEAAVIGNIYENPELLEV